MPVALTLWAQRQIICCSQFSKTRHPYCLCCSQSPKEPLGFDLSLAGKCSIPQRSEVQGPTLSTRVSISPKTDGNVNQISLESDVRRAELYLILGVIILQTVNSCLAGSFVGNGLSCNHTIWLKTPRVRFMSPHSDVPVTLLQSALRFLVILLIYDKATNRGKWTDNQR